MDAIGLAVLVAAAVAPHSTVQIETRCLGDLTPIVINFTSDSIRTIEIKASTSLSNSTLTARRRVGGVDIYFQERFKDGDSVIIRTFLSNDRSDLSDRMLSAGETVSKDLVDYFYTTKQIVDEIDKDVPINIKKIRNYFTQCPISKIR